MDSTISNCYINGGEEPTENACFQWRDYNGFILSNNFIDYYRTIYEPISMATSGCTFPLSIGNQYQVFRYFYFRRQDSNIQSIKVYSISDSFNWTNPESLEKLKTYIPFQYEGKDGMTYDYPPFLAVVSSVSMVYMKDVKIEGNIGNIIHVDSGIGQYEYTYFNFTVADFKQSSFLNTITFKEGDERPIYNGGNYKYRHNFYNVEGIYEQVDELPSILLGWSSRPVGHTVFF